MRILLIISWISWTAAQNQPSCDSLIYCQGNLLHTVQMAQIFNDSKTFVDMKMLYPPETTLKNFNSLMNNTNNQPTKQDIRQFVFANFEINNEFDNWIPKDYNMNPKFLDRICNEKVRTFARNLVNIWPILARKVKPEVFQKPNQFSLIPVPNGFIIPGGRFKEFYYWDSYWIIKGLLISEMTETAKGMLDNFLLLVKKYGFIPNGARVYYLNRSQPPLLTMMVDAYFKTTNDIQWIADNVEYLDQELTFWLDYKTINVNKNGQIYVLAHYNSENGTPRPESYLEDIRTAQIYPTEEEKRQVYADLKSGAESGWDFSSRWIFDQNGGTNANISHIQTRRVIPVDLNAYLCKSFRILAKFYSILQDSKRAIFWLEKSKIWQKTIEEVLYDPEDGIWYDYDLKLSQLRKLFYPSNFAPLWTESYNPLDASRIGKKAVEYFQKLQLDYPGGIPTSLSHTGEQWDFPNAWAPLQATIVFGLEKTGDPDAKTIARDVAKKWVEANFLGFQATNEMFEKYDAVHPGQFGGGGEYEVQSGFGWTNGVVLEFINYFYTRKY